MRKFTLPDEPTDVGRVESLDGSEKVFRYEPRNGYSSSWGNWVDKNGSRFTWDEILNEWGGAIELPKSDIEKALDYFATKSIRELRVDFPTDAFNKHTQALIDHAKETAK